MRKLSILLLLVIMGGVIVYAQSTEQDNNTPVESVSKDTGRLLLREISISTFEDPTLWMLNIPVDKGYSEKRRIAGSPKDKQPLKLEEQINNYTPVDTHVLGAKFGFYGRDLLTLSVTATEPIYMPGVVKVMSVWVAGRGKDHMLSAVLRGMDGEVYTLPLGKINFSGWNKMEVAIPGDIPQQDPSGTHGLYFLGFIIETAFEQTVGRYYVYFDDMRIVSDVIDEVIKLEADDDIGDGW